MSSNSSARPPMRKYSRDSNRRKTALNVDLNARPAEAVNPSRRSQPPPPPAAEAAAPVGVSVGLVSSPIDVEAIDDDVQMLSSPRGFPQTRNQSRRRNRPVILVVDEDREGRTGHSGVPGNGPVGVSCYNRRNMQQRVPPNTNIINCEHYYISEDDNNAKRKKARIAEPEKVVPKEPTFSCPICMGTLVSACSTTCGHIFCGGCIKASLDVQKKCPTCRAKLTMRNVHKVFLPTTTTAD